jgi:hypothetical protein
MHVGSAYGWGWRECAAAVFVAGADKRDYGEVCRTFRRWSTHNNAGH